mgnify:FL=1
MKIKGLVPAAGKGTRGGAAYKATSKPGAPILDRPSIQWTVEFLADAGISPEDIGVVVSSDSRQQITDHFCKSGTLLANSIRSKGSDELGKKMYRSMADTVMRAENFKSMAFIEQETGVGIPYGNGMPILQAEDFLADHPFIYTFSDDLFLSSGKNEIEQLIDAFRSNEGKGSFLSCLLTSDEADKDRFGMIDGNEVEINGRKLIEIEKIIEKPGAGSSLLFASVSSYLFEPAFLEYLKKAELEFDGNGEFSIQPTIQRMIEDGYKFYAVPIDGGYFDTGNPVEFTMTQVAFALSLPQFSMFRDKLAKLVASDPDLLKRIEDIH